MAEKKPKGKATQGWDKGRQRDDQNKANITKLKAQLAAANARIVELEAQLSLFRGTAWGVAPADGLSKTKECGDAAG